MVTQNYVISTVKNSVKPRVKMSQYDHGGRTIAFTVVDGSGMAVDLTGKSVTVEGTRSDGHAFATTCTVADNTVAFVDIVDMTNEAGDHPAELVIRQNDERLGTMNFIISVEPAAMDEGADVSPEDKNLFEQLYAKVVSGSPVAVDTVAEMTNTDGVYLYTGSESGYTKGYWYYYNGSAWVAGGAYGSGEVDKTLTLSDVAADAKVVGDIFDEITDYVLESYVTDYELVSTGLTFRRISDTQVAVFGTATANRRYNIFNGQHKTMTTTSTFDPILPAGTYKISISAQNLTSDQVRIAATYDTYSSNVANVYVGTSKVVECTAPIMFGLNVPNGTVLGTEENPAIITAKVERNTAKDEATRYKIDRIATHETVSGDVAYFPDGADGYPVKSLTVAVEPIQSGSGDPSPSNVRPISGRSSVKVARTGKNIIPDNAWVENYLIDASGEVASNSSYKYCEKYIKVNSSTAYTVSFNKTATGNMGVTIPMYDANKVFLERQTAFTGTATGYLTGTVTTTAETAYIRITVPKTGGSDYQMEQGSTATTYEPYTSRDYTILIGETVYGGTLDVVGGKMIADRKAVDMGDLTWASATSGFYAGLSDAVATKGGGDVNALCSAYKRVAYNSSTFANGNFCVCDNNFSGTKRVLVKDTSYSEATDFKTAVTGQTLVYTLATPIEIPLTPTQINTLLGGNTIWADAGDVSVEYVADTKLYIAKAIASALSS